MQQNFCIRPRRQGSITLFLALILTLVFSLFFSLLEAARVQALSQIAKRSLWFWRIPDWVMGGLSAFVFGWQ